MAEKNDPSELEKARKVRALVVDDDTVIQKIHRMFLNRHGLEIVVVDNGKKAVDLFISGKTFDLVLMDLEMPVMDGRKATMEIRAMGVASMIVGVTSCPVEAMGVASMIVGVTSCPVEAEKTAFMAAGLDDCVDKPLTGAAVVNVLDELAKRHSYRAR